MFFTGSRMNQACLTLLCLALFVPSGAQAQRYRDKEFNALDLANLPKYCYAQYVDERLSKDPQHSIQGCGPFVNHFCPAVVSLNRASNPTRNKAERRRLVEFAIRETGYTLQHMPNGCWLRADADAVMMRARQLEMLFK